MKQCRELTLRDGDVIREREPHMHTAVLAHAIDVATEEEHPACWRTPAAAGVTRSLPRPERGRFA